MVDLSADWPLIAQQPTHSPASDVVPQNLAYVIYTSGSTGRPKGVLTTHRSVANYVPFLVETYRLGADNRVLQLAPFSFDASVRDMICPLLVGAQVVIVDSDDARDPAALLATIRRRRITNLMSVVPSRLKSLIEAARADAAYDSVRLVLLSGENLYLSDCREARAVFGEGVAVVNQYGATECTMTSSYYRVDAARSDLEIALAGRPLFNTQIYILDRYLQPAPIGVPGEIYIGGLGLARGYLNDPAMTAEKFVPNPFATTTNDQRPMMTECTPSPRHPVTLSPCHLVTQIGSTKQGTWAATGRTARSSTSAGSISR